MQGDIVFLIRNGLLPRHRQAFGYSTSSYPVLVCLAVRIVITVSPQDVHYTLGLEEVRFHCEASSDDSTPVNITWEKDNAPINMGRDSRIFINATELIIKLIGLSTNDIETNYTGQYMCIASDGYTIAKAKAAFKYGKFLWNWFSSRILWYTYQELFVFIIDLCIGFMLWDNGPLTRQILTKYYYVTWYHSPGAHFIMQTNHNICGMAFMTSTLIWSNIFH